MTPATDETIAAVNGADAIRLEALLSDGGSALANSFTEDGWSLLHLAPNREIAEILLDYGAEVNAKNRQKVIGPENRPLHAAAYMGRDDVAAILLERGADPNAVDVAGFTPLHLAAANGHVDVVRTLLARGANPGCRTTSDTTTAPAGTTPLMLAADVDRLGDDGRPIGGDRLRAVAEVLRRHGAVG